MAGAGDPQQTWTANSPWPGRGWGGAGARLAPVAPHTEEKFSVLSPDEKEILAECQQEGFYYRGLPLALSFGYAGHALAPALLPHPGLHHRAGLVLAGALAGFGLGHLAYSGHCASKFLARAPDGVVALDIRLKAEAQVVPYSIFSPINQAAWRRLASEREQERLHWAGGRRFQLGFEVDPEFQQQNVMEANIARWEEGPVRYGVFQHKEESDGDGYSDSDE